MPYRRKPQNTAASIRTVTIGTGERQLELGGENVFPFYSFDGGYAGTPKVGLAITDLGLDREAAGIRDYYAGADSIGEIAGRAAAGADFVCLRLAGGDPGGKNRPVDELVAIACEAAAGTDALLAIEGCGNAARDAELLPKLAAALSGRNLLFLSAKEENEGPVGAGVAVAAGQKLAAESSVDINLAKQLNVVLIQAGVAPESIVMHAGASAAGYGFEYLVSTMDRIRGAALSQDDRMLQMPIITPVDAEAWSVKESTASEEDMPEWGSAEERGISMEIQTAAASLAAGADAVIVRHPRSAAALLRMIRALT